MSISYTGDNWWDFILPEFDRNVKSYIEFQDTKYLKKVRNMFELALKKKSSHIDERLLGNEVSKRISNRIKDEEFVIIAVRYKGKALDQLKLSYEALENSERLDPFAKFSLAQLLLNAEKSLNSHTKRTSYALYCLNRHKERASCYAELLEFAEYVKDKTNCSPEYLEKAKTILGNMNKEAQLIEKSATDKVMAKWEKQGIIQIKLPVK